MSARRCIILVPFIIFLFSCNNPVEHSPSNSDDNIFESVNLTDIIIGKWIPVRVRNICYDTDNNVVKDTSMPVSEISVSKSFVDIKIDSIYQYVWAMPSDSFYYLYINAYDLNGNNFDIQGYDPFAGTPGMTFLSRIIGAKGDTLIVKVAYTVSLYAKQETETYSIRYDGILPPSNWPVRDSVIR